MFLQYHPMIVSLLESRDWQAVWDEERCTLSSLSLWQNCYCDGSVCMLLLNALHNVFLFFFFLILPSSRLRERGRQAEMNNDAVKKENPHSIRRLDSVFTNTEYSQSTDMRIEAVRLIMCSTFRIWELIFTQIREVCCAVLDITELDDFHVM